MQLSLLEKQNLIALKTTKDSMFISHRFLLCITLFIGIIFHEGILFAADVCSVNNQASPEFLEYQNKLSVELGKVRSEIATKTQIGRAHV